MIEAELLRIDSVESSGSHTTLRLNHGQQICLRPFIYVKPGDLLEFVPNFESYGQINKVLANKTTGLPRRIKIYPPYTRSESVCIPPHELYITFRERFSSRDWKNAKLLEQFHYRGKGLNKLVGRRTVLIVEAEGYGIIGYGVLSATVAAAKPRFQLFKINFREQMATKLINQLVRIPRIVIHPEFRGLGIGVLTAKHLVRYAKSYWDINGYTPVMVEVIASMTDYHRFFEKAGFVKVGYTLGSEKGIVPEYGVGEWQQRPNHEQYDFFSDKKPKPYLVFPISHAVQRMVNRMNLTKPRRDGLPRRKRQLAGPIKFERLSTEYRVSNVLTIRAEEIKQAFAVDATQMHSPVLKDLTLTIDPGDVILVTGASGSGKSTLIRFLVEKLEDLKKNMNIEGEIKGVDPNEVAKLGAKWNEDLPLIDQVGDSAQAGIELLNSVGLAEAHLYLKRPCQISDGQLYRFAVALLCDSKKSVWVADEFTSTLDPLTAAIVAKGLRKCAWEYGATLVLAAPHVEHFVDSLLPNKLIWLRWGGTANIFSMRCKYKRQDKNLQLKIVNTCNNELTEILVGGVRQTGQVKEIRKLGALLPGKRSDAVEIPWEDIAVYSALAITCKQRVGDLIYI